MSKLHAIIKKIQSNLKVLEWSQHYISIFKMIKRANSIIGDVIWQKSNSFKLLLLSLIAARRKNFHPKMKALEWSHSPTISLSGHSRCSKAANSVVGDGVVIKFNLIQAFIVVLVTCMNEKIYQKNEGTRVVTTFLS